ncbi:MAG: hypothetical protein HYZ08_03175 [Candidatus Kerfeldbacteria bacterium]|nr:hypothetical protein [Candidatus Kerfeldbacteria bacterium]
MAIRAPSQSRRALGKSTSTSHSNSVTIYPWALLTLSSISMNDERILSKLEEHDQRFSGIEKILISHDERFSDHDQQFVIIQEKLEEHMVFLRENMVFRDEFNEQMAMINQKFERIDERFDIVFTYLDQQMVILKRLDEERLFVNEHIRRNTDDIERIKSHIHLV